MSRHWVLVGLMGSGKTTVGTLLAQRSGRAFIDNDVQLSASSGHTAREIQADAGPDALHALEGRALADALGSATASVIAAAASVVEDAALRARLQRETVVIWLRTDVETLSRRVERDDHRPLGEDALTKLRHQAATRSTLFSEIADLVVDAGRSPEEIVDDVLASVTLL